MPKNICLENVPIWGHAWGPWWCISCQIEYTCTHMVYCTYSHCTKVLVIWTLHPLASSLSSNKNQYNTSTTKGDAVFKLQILLWGCIIPETNPIFFALCTDAYVWNSFVRHLVLLLNLWSIVKSHLLFPTLWRNFPHSSWQIHIPISFLNYSSPRN